MEDTMEGFFHPAGRGQEGESESPLGVREEP